MPNRTGLGVPSTGAVFNDADVRFAQMILVHHRQTIEMASLADTRAARVDVKAVATRSSRRSSLRSTPCMRG